MVLLPAFLAHPMVAPAAIVLASVGMLLNGKKKPETLESEPHPVFDAEARAILLDTTAENGLAVQSFKTEIASVIVRALGGFGLENDSPPGNDSRLFYKLIPPTGDLSAAQAALTAQANGLVVMGSLSLALVETNADKFLLFVKPNERVLAAPQGQFAVLLNATIPVPASAPEFTTDDIELDASLPPDVQDLIRKNLKNESPNIAEMAEAAAAFEHAGMPLATQAIRARMSDIVARARPDVSVDTVAGEQASVAVAAPEPVIESASVDTAPISEKKATSRTKRASKRAAKLNGKNGLAHKPILSIVSEPLAEAAS